MYGPVAAAGARAAEPSQVAPDVVAGLVAEMMRVAAGALAAAPAGGVAVEGVEVG